MGTESRRRGGDSQRTSLCNILLPLLPADYRPGLLGRPTPTRTHPCSRIRTVDYFSFAQQRRQAEEYASLRFPLAPLAGTDRLLLFATTTGSCYTLLLVCSGTHPCSRIPSRLFCATALLQAHRELGRRRTSTPPHTKLIQQDDNPFATHGIPVLISPLRSLRSTCRVSYVRKNGEFISELCAVTTFSVS